MSTLAAARKLEVCDLCEELTTNGKTFDLIICDSCLEELDKLMESHEQERNEPLREPDELEYLWPEV